MKRIPVAILTLAASCAAAAQQVQVEMNAIDIKGVGAPIGRVTLEASGQGTVFTPNLSHLKPGEHGFHVHEFGNCGAKQKDGKMSAGEMAGGHLDPRKTHKHAGPQGGGHLGDLPLLMVDAQGKATQPVTAPRLALKDIRGKSLMIHAGGDNDSDQPKPNGGGGERVACGVIPAR